MDENVKKKIIISLILYLTSNAHKIEKPVFIYKKYFAESTKQYFIKADEVFSFFENEKDINIRVIKNKKKKHKILKMKNIM